MQNILSNIDSFLTMFSFPRMRVNDVIDIIIVSILIYEVIRWIRNTRAWALFKGLMVLAIFTIVATVLQLHTIMWLLESVFNIGILALVIIFQPELRRALESLGKKNVIANFLTFEEMREESEFDEKSIQAITKACVEMGKAKTGALIVIEQEVGLKEIERTGIQIDGRITSQLLINIFEHNTPLHDGAVLIRDNRIIAATCYLPLSDDLAIAKELGTRHRAAIGMSETSDALIIVVSEETGSISVAQKTKLKRDLAGVELREELEMLVDRKPDTKKFKFWRGRGQ